ncbi:TetR/AcrR family transcriptional regulator [Streptomyces phytophilus]|uniref:TetR/AcrR family transcriptional regulator n=1 Tax=Streptomyces phytophilus TaxID=722715 RepID=UPI0015F06AF8|nr:TetR/AcrR family transcriptional regulator [Streptomyces phytophilus]
MPRPADPARKTALLDSVVDYLVDHGLATLSMRPLAKELGQSTRVLTHHFADKADLLNATLTRLDERQREWLAGLPGADGEMGMGEVVRATWEYHLTPEHLPLTRLIHEIEGLAAGDRLGGATSRLLADRVEFVAGWFRDRGVPAEAATDYATLLNAAFAGLQIDMLNTGDRERTTAAAHRLADLADGWVAAHAEAREEA